METIDPNELKYYSVCCIAPPLYELYYEEEYDAEPLGTCMKCRQKSLFDLWGDEDPYDPITEGVDDGTKSTNSNIRVTTKGTKESS
jgi:hypothetical protein